MNHRFLITCDGRAIHDPRPCYLYEREDAERMVARLNAIYGDHYGMVEAEASQPSDHHSSSDTQQEQPMQETSRTQFWKARAIYIRPSFDIVHDRTNTGDGSAGLREWLNESGLKALKVQLILKDLEPSSIASVRVDDGEFHVEASPGGSYGYLYIRSWADGSEEACQGARYF